jgi:hypothetical protein
VLHATEFEHTAYWFEYGTTTAYGSTTPIVDIEATTVPNPVSASVGGLAAGTTYHYRLCNDKVLGDSFPPHCGADRTVTTGNGRVSVEGSGSDAIETPPFSVSTTQYSLEGVADPGGAGYVDGDWNLQTQNRYVPELSSFDTDYGEVASVVCLRVSGNLAVAGVVGSWRGGTLSTGVFVNGSFDALIVIEDNGPTGDRVAKLPWTPADGCPEPSASLFTGRTFDVADFVVSGG